MERFLWSALSGQQKGAFAEYFVKMELTMHGFEVYGTEVDDRGIDFIARKSGGPFFELQVKSAQKTNYVFMTKEKFPLTELRYLALVVLEDHAPPLLYLVPSMAWQQPNSLLVSHDYSDKHKSKPEWGLSLAKRYRKQLDAFRFERTLELLMSR